MSAMWLMPYSWKYDMIKNLLCIPSRNLRDHLSTENAKYFLKPWEAFASLKQLILHDK